jgi:integrase/recombinase XerC
MQTNQHFEHQQEFEHYLQSLDLSKNTVSGYLSDLSLFARWFFETNDESLRPDRLTPIDVRAYKQYLLTVKQRKASTINRRLAALSAYVGWAREMGQIEHDPTEQISGVAQSMPAPKYLDKKEQYALLRAIEKDLQVAKFRFHKRWVTRRRDASLVIFMLNTGLRSHETLGLRLGDINISDRKGEVFVRKGEGDKQRTVPLNKDARQAINAWLAERPEEQDNSYVWIAVETEAEGSLHQRSLQRIMKRYGEDAGLENLTPHMLRHTFAKNLVDQGIGLEKVAALLGHSSLNTTRIYVTPSQKDLKSAVESLSGEKIAEAV